MKNYVPADELKLIHSGNDYFDVLEELIVNARERIDIQTYILEYDQTGKRIILLLKEAVQRGVRVTLLADAFGSSGFPKEGLKEMEQSGIRARLFSPLFSSEAISFGRRLHHKIVVADNTAALIGGINLADKYHGSLPTPPWLDYAVLIRGQACGYLAELCESIYDRKTEFLHGHMNPEGQKGVIRFRRNDWIKGKNEIHRSYVEAIIGAEKSITLVASYFLPGRLFRKLLKEAVAKGVRIRIILAGKSDLAIIPLAEKYLYYFYLQNKIEIYEWDNSVMHGKAMTVDGMWTTIGSYNLNNLSHYLSIELNADITDQHFVDVFDKHLDEIISTKCKAVTLDTFQRKRSLWFRIRIRLGYEIYKLLMLFMMRKRVIEKKTVKSGRGGI
ncbi:MAG TPA: phospholipase D-like domain-containing protein [Bacteroidia bacterium]|jgi:cardiolipin synthase|nr:phospholipase D-like domain-containing protein [Bacteroidia bacterium]